jgi:ADP-ribosyl-[dinitrogen reductase] hydrolase
MRARQERSKADILKDMLRHIDPQAIWSEIGPPSSRTAQDRPAELVYERARAAYLGLAIGDALGATTEFMTPREIKSKYKVHRKIVGGGWLYLKPGQVTDDTEMSLALGKAVIIAGQWDLKGVADHFDGWMKSKPIDIGATCRRGIRDYRFKGQLEVPYNEWDAGNGAAMRMAPVALFTLGDDQLLRKYAIQQAHLTHNHKLSDAACIVIGRMVQQGILGDDRHRLHETTRKLITEHQNFRFNNYRGESGSYVVDTLKTVFHYFFTTSSFEECLLGVVNQGGDADTTGAIAGMIAGAFYGFDAIPARWLKKLNKAVRTEVEDQALRLVKLSPWPQNIRP